MQFAHRPSRSAKQRHVTANDDKARVGDMWTFVALEPDTKLVPTYRVGKRNRPTAVAFMEDLSTRLSNRVQLSSDALKTYVDVVERAFGADVDYGQAVKFYEAQTIGPGRYSPPKVVDQRKTVITRRPDQCPYLVQPCWASEPHHAHVLAPVHSADECFQQEGREPTGCRGAALRAL